MALNKCIPRDIAVSLLLQGGVLYADKHTKIIHRVNTETREHVIESIDKTFYYIALNSGRYNVRATDLTYICKAAHLDRGAIPSAPEWCSLAPIL